MILTVTLHALLLDWFYNRMSHLTPSHSCSAASIMETFMLILRLEPLSSGLVKEPTI